MKFLKLVNFYQSYNLAIINFKKKIIFDLIIMPITLGSAVRVENRLSSSSKGCPISIYPDLSGNDQITQFEISIRETTGNKNSLGKVIVNDEAAIEALLKANTSATPYVYYLKYWKAGDVVYELSGNVVYDITLSFILNNMHTRDAIIIPTYMEDGEPVNESVKSLTIMLAPTDGLYRINTRAVTKITNKRVLQFDVESTKVPIKLLNFQVFDRVTEQYEQYLKYLIDDASYGFLGVYNVSITAEDISAGNITLVEDRQYAIEGSVTAMDNNAIPTASINAVFAPGRTEKPSILSVKQVNVDNNDQTLEIKFKPPVDELALTTMGLSVESYIITDNSNNIATSDGSSNYFIYSKDASQNGIWFDDVNMQYKNTNGTVVSNYLTQVSASSLRPLDGSGCYSSNVFNLSLLKNNTRITNIGITAVTSDKSVSATSTGIIDYSGDSALGMILAPAKPSISSSQIDGSGNLTLNVSGRSRSLDVSGSFTDLSGNPVKVFVLDGSGNLVANSSSLTLTSTTTSSTLPSRSYTSVNFQVKVPYASLPPGIDNKIGVTLQDISGNKSFVSDALTYNNQKAADKPFFKLTEFNAGIVNGVGQTKVYISFDTSGNDRPHASYPLIGLGAARGVYDASVNPFVELTIHTKLKAATEWTAFSGNPFIIPTNRYTLLRSDSSGVLIDTVSLPAGYVIKVSGKIITDRIGTSDKLTSLISNEVQFETIELTKPVTELQAVSTTMAKTDIVRNLSFKFVSPAGGAALLRYKLDYYVNDLNKVVFSHYIDASGVPMSINANPNVKQYRVNLSSDSSANQDPFTTGPSTLSPSTTNELTDMSFNLTQNDVKFTWGDVVKVKVSSLPAATIDNRVSDPGYAELLMVPSAPLDVTAVAFTPDGSFNDLVTYTITHHGSPVLDLTSMSVFWENIDASASAMTVAPTMLSKLIFPTVTPGVTYSRNVGDVSGNGWFFTKPALAAGTTNNIIDLNYTSFSATVTRSGAAVPETSTLKVKYNTGEFKPKNADGTLATDQKQEGLKAIFSVMSGKNQLTNSEVSNTDYELRLV